MKPALIITSHVINTINALPDEERQAITSTLAADLLLGEETASESLTPMQQMIYTMIRSYVTRDTARFSGSGNTVRTLSSANDPFCHRAAAI